MSMCNLRLKITPLNRTPNIFLGHMWWGCHKRGRNGLSFLGVSESLKRCVEGPIFRATFRESSEGVRLPRVSKNTAEVGFWTPTKSMGQSRVESRKVGVKVGMKVGKNWGFCSFAPT